jgi:hypothetical protein
MTSWLIFTDKRGFGIMYYAKSVQITSCYSEKDIMCNKISKYKADVWESVVSIFKFTEIYDIDMHVNEIDHC